MFSSLTLTACQSPPRGASARRINLAPGPPSATPRWSRVVGQSVMGRPIELEGFGDGPEVVLLLAGIHGNEAAGVPLLRDTADMLDQKRGLTAGRTVLMVRHVNPDGLANGKRFNIRGVDLNRNFPAENFDDRRRYGRQPLNQPESRMIQELIQHYQPDRIVSIHQPLNCIDYDGPPAASRLAQAMAAACDLSAKKLGTRPGSLGAYAGKKLGIPIITLELPKKATGMSRQILWQHYGPAILTAIRGGDTRAVNSDR